MWLADDVKRALPRNPFAPDFRPFQPVAGIPAQTFQYRLGNRCTLEWVIDQYLVKQDKRSGIRSDPNWADDEEYIVGQVVRASVETGRVVAGLPSSYSG
jgi:predicted helicase